jgi:glycogen operon protein
MARNSQTELMLRLDDGLPEPYGASYDGSGVNFAVFSAHATNVDLCLFDSSGRREIARLPLPRRTEQVWHGYVSGIGPGQLYGYRVHGPYEPERGHRFNPNKLLIDPYARQLAGRLRWHDALFAYRSGTRGDSTADKRDSAPMMPKCVVEPPEHLRGDDRPPRRAMRDSVIYEAHVKGLTQLHPDVPLPARGTYDALAHPAVIDHLLKIGVTAVELLPIHAFVDDRFLVNRGLRNYWGYSTLAYFAPEPRYFSAAGANGLRGAISSLHDAGIEVILDVVYNHTAEGNELGPTLSFRGIDNASYYKLLPDDPRHYWDSTGTGSTLDVSQPQVLRLVLDSLRHWVESYRIDGFRFDLASALARNPFDFDERSGFLASVSQDPVLRQVKLIAEPWDVGPGGYRVGGYPLGWSEWNDQYRDGVRAFWRGDPGRLPALARAITGSREVFEPSGRQSWASINFVTAHDGFTLRDLVSYNERHNQANGENNADGHDHNLSWNGGVEGPTDDPGVNALRDRQQRNFLSSLMLSIGTPMITMGDELGRTQKGNNNAYCQDNATSWVDWPAIKAPHELTVLLSRLAEVRRTAMAFRRNDFLNGFTHSETELKDVYWLAPEGRDMTDTDWHDPERRVLGCQFGNEPGDGDRLLLVFNASARAAAFNLAPDFPAIAWQPLIDTTSGTGVPAEPMSILRPGGTVLVEGRSLHVFRHVAQPDRA